MEFLIIFIVIALVGIITTVLFWGFVIKLFVNHMSKFEQEEMRLNQLLSQYATQNQHPKKGEKKKQLTNSELEILARMNNMKNHYNQMDSLRREQYETRISGMIGNVTGAGFTNFDINSFY